MKKKTLFYHKLLYVSTAKMFYEPNLRAEKVLINTQVGNRFA